MNCDEFEDILMDLARAQIIDARVRAQAVCHTESCRKCWTRLADERELTAGLEVMAAGMAFEEAPPFVEDRLLAELRAQSDKVRARRAPLTPLPKSIWIDSRLVISAAAIVVMALILGAILMTRSSAPFAPAGAESALPAHEASDESHEKAQPSNLEPQEPRTANVESAVKPEHIRKPGAERTHSGRGLKPDLARQTADGEQEIATAFIPLMYDDPVAGVDSGQIVRVRMSRSALISLGIPMNFDNAEKQINADVVVGEDGLARAIRFVR
jgi:hypothetical protein